MKRNFLIVIAFAAGLSLGVYLSNPQRVKAQNSTNVRIKQFSVLQGEGGGRVVGEVAGFACTQGPSNAVCYVLTR